LLQTVACIFMFVNRWCDVQVVEMSGETSL
jgi:hypothetical protein